MFQTKVVQKIKTHILCSITVFLKSCRLWDNVEKYGTDRQATDDNMLRRMRIAFWITKAAYTHLENEIFTAFPRQRWLHERASVLRLHVYCLSFKQAIISLIQLMPSINSEIQPTSKGVSTYWKCTLIHIRKDTGMPHTTIITEFLISSVTSLCHPVILSHCPALWRQLQFPQSKLALGSCCCLKHFNDDANHSLYVDIQLRSVSQSETQTRVSSYDLIAQEKALSSFPETVQFRSSKSQTHLGPRLDLNQETPT
jgi:hypothetical protein